MHPNLAPIDVAQHLPFLDRKLIRTPPAVRRALWLVAMGQVAAEGEPCPVRARCLTGSVDHPDAPEPWVGSGGTAGRVSVVLRELEDRGVLVGYRGRGRRPHLWSFRPKLERWQGFHWEDPVSRLSEVVSECFCLAASDLVARFPGQSLFQVTRRAKFELLPRDHITPPGLFLVENGDKVKGRAPKRQRPGANPVDTRDNREAGAAAVLSIGEEVELLQLSEEEERRFYILKSVVEFHGRPKTVWPGTAPERQLRELACTLSDGQVEHVRRTFDNSTDRLAIPQGVNALAGIAANLRPRKTATAG